MGLRTAASPFLTAKLPTKGLTVSDPTYGHLKLDANLTFKELVAALRSDAVPYIECDRKCLASHLCPFTESDPRWPGRLKEIKCGYQTAVIENFLRSTLPSLKPRRREDMRRLLDACLAFKEFAFGIFFTSAGIGDPAHTRWAGRYFLGVSASHARGAMRGARDFINTLRPYEGMFIRPTVIFVEGKTEYAVLASAFAKRDGLEIRNLGGSTRLDYLRAGLQECYREHVLPGLILDRCTTITTLGVEKLIAEGLIKRRNVRILPGDFEDTFDAKLLRSIAEHTVAGVRLQATHRALADRLGCRQKGFSKCLRQHLIAVGVSTSGLSSAIADIKARLRAGIVEVIEQDRTSFDNAVYAVQRRGERRPRVSQFIRLCRWMLGVEGSDFRERVVAGES